MEKLIRVMAGERHKLGSMPRFLVAGLPPTYRRDSSIGLLLLFLVVLGWTGCNSKSDACAVGASCGSASGSASNGNLSVTNTSPSTEMVAKRVDTRMVSQNLMNIAEGQAASASAEPAQSQAKVLGPTLFFSDLDSGPNIGNTDTSLGQVAGRDGVIVTIWGARLGDSQGSSQVFYNGVPADHVYFWGSSKLDGRQKVVFQISHTASNGPGEITVLVNGIRSNALTFTVRPGNIHFVATGGRDSSHGNFSSPWKTLIKARDAMHPGDITYAMDGVSQTTEDGEGWDAAFTLRAQWCSASGYPRGIVGYPGARVTIGNPNGRKPAVGIRSTDYSAGGGACVGNWTFAGLNLRGIAPAAINGPSHQWRFVGNDISCPNSDGGDGGGACFETIVASNVAFYGNVVHDAGTAGASALFHGVYFSTDTNHLDMGWNVVYNIHGCRGVQIHSSPLGSNYPKSGYAMYDLSIHDNLIHDTQCDGIIVDTIDPSKGPISIYNNIIYNAGKGPNNPERTGGWSCINIVGATENGAPGSGTVDVYNNTLYACGVFAKPPYGSANAGVTLGGNPNLYVQLRNNLIYQIPTSLHPAGVPYVVIWNPLVKNGGAVCGHGDNCPWMKGANNLFYGSGPMAANLSNITGSIYSDPYFVDVGKFDFHIAANSPAASAGTPTSAMTDHDGVPLPHGPAYPIGAYAAVP